MVVDSSVHLYVLLLCHLLLHLNTAWRRERERRERERERERTERERERERVAIFLKL